MRSFWKFGAVRREAKHRAESERIRFQQHVVRQALATGRPMSDFMPPEEPAPMRMSSDEKAERIARIIAFLLIGVPLLIGVLWVLYKAVVVFLTGYIWLIATIGTPLFVVTWPIARLFGVEHVTWSWVIFIGTQLLILGAILFAISRIKAFMLERRVERLERTAERDETAEPAKDDEPKQAS
jgi:hypothetical protein